MGRRRLSLRFQRPGGRRFGHLEEDAKTQQTSPPQAALQIHMSPRIGGRSWQPLRMGVHSGTRYSERTPGRSNIAPLQDMRVRRGRLHQNRLDSGHHRFQIQEQAGGGGEGEVQGVQSEMQLDGVAATSDEGIQQNYEYIKKRTKDGEVI